MPVQRIPLAKEEELREAGPVDRVREVLAGRGERTRFPEAKFVGPVLPAPAAVRSLDGHELGVVVEPQLLGPESLELIDEFRISSSTPESGVRRSEEAPLPRDHDSEVDVLVREVRPVRRFDEAVVDEEVRGNEVDIAGECRETLIRRVTVSGRADRERLPETGAGLCKEVNPFVGRGPDIADPEGAGEGGRM